MRSDTFISFKILKKSMILQKQTVLHIKAPSQHFWSQKDRGVAKVIIHKLGGEKLRFGLVLDRLAILKKIIWVDYEQLLQVVFSCFHGQKKINFFLKYFSVRSKKLHKMKVNKKLNFFLKI